MLFYNFATLSEFKLGRACRGEIRVERLQKTVGGSRRTKFKVTGFGAAWLTEV